MTQPGYTVEGLEHGIERARINIETLEAAIVKERETIKEYRRMIDGLEKAAKDLKHAQDHILDQVTLVH